MASTSTGNGHIVSCLISIKLTTAGSSQSTLLSLLLHCFFTKMIDFWPLSHVTWNPCYELNSVSFFFFFPVQRSLSCNGVTRRTIQRVITRVINHRWQDKHILLTWSQIPKVHFCACLFSQVFAKLKRQNPSRAKSKLSNPLVCFFLFSNAF